MGACGHTLRGTEEDALPGRQPPKGQGSPHMAKLRLSNPREAGSLCLLLALVWPCLGCREHSLLSHCSWLLSSYSSHGSTLIPVVWKNPSVTLPSFRSRVRSGGLSKVLATCRSLYCFPDDPHPQEKLPLRGGSFLSTPAAGAVNYLEELCLPHYGLSDPDAGPTNL